MDSTRWYPSKVDAWLGASLVISPVFATSVAVYATYRAGTKEFVERPIEIE